MDSLTRLLGGDERAVMRAVAGLLLGVAMIVIVIRRTYTLDPWGDFAVFLALAAPTAVLLGAGYLGARGRGGEPTGWQIVFAIFGVLLLPLALYTFLQWIGGDTSSSWNAVWIFGLVAIAAFGVALVAGVRAGCLLGALALLIVWLSFWDEIVSDGLGSHATTTRWLLLIAGGLLAALASGLSMRARPEGGSSDVLTIAGLAAIGAGAISLGALSTPLIGVSDLGGPSSAIGSSTFWELELLVVSLALIVHGATATVRGPVYAGALGLLAFIPVVGVDAGSLDLDGSLWGWPVVLIVVAVGLLAASFGPALRAGRG